MEANYFDPDVDYGSWLDAMDNGDGTDTDYSDRGPDDGVWDDIVWDAFNS